MKIAIRTALLICVLIFGKLTAQAQCAPDPNFCVPNNDFSDIPFCISPSIGPTIIVGNEYSSIDVNWALGRTITYPPGNPVTVVISRIEIIQILNAPPGVNVEVRSGNPADVGVATLTNLPFAFNIDPSIPATSPVGIFGCTRFQGTPENVTTALDSVIIRANFYVREIDINGNAVGPLVDPDTTNMLGFTVNPRTFEFPYQVDSFKVTIPTNYFQANCGDEVLVITSANASKLNYQWSPATGLNDPTIASPIATPNATTTYTLTTSYGFISTTQTVTVEITGIDDAVVINPPSPSCKPQSFPLQANGTGEIRWYDVAAGGSPVATGSIFNTPVLSSPTTYYVVNSNGNCESERIPIQIQVLTPPDAIFDYFPANPRAGSAIVFANNSINADNYSWNFGVPGGTTTTEDPTFTYAAEGEYFVTLIAINAAGCADTLRDTIIVGPKGVDEAFSGNLKLYPNPTKTAFTIELPEAEHAVFTLKMINALGQTVYIRQLNRQTRHDIQLPNLPIGIYQVQLNDENKQKAFTGQVLIKP